MKIILVEFPWQIKKITENKNFQNHIIVSTDPEASYILKKNNLRYFEAEGFCDHKIIWAKYKQITENSLNIVKILDKYLWRFDKRFRDLKWNFFDDLHYNFKISYEQVYYYIELILQLVEKFNPSEFTIADTENIKFDKHLLIDINISLFKFLLTNLKITEKKIEIKYMKPSNKIIVKKFSKNLIKNKLKNFYYKLNFYYNYFVTKPKYFAVNCHEIKMFKKLYSRESNKYICYNYENISHDNAKGKWKYFEDFWNELNEDLDFKELTNYKKVNYGKVFFYIISQLSKNFGNFIKEYNNAKKIIYKIKPKCLIFQSMICIHLPNIIFKKVCKDLKLPYVVWDHGGYDGFSLPGNDVTDYRFCQNHISYGVHLSETIKDKRCILNKLNMQKNQKIYPIGSLIFDYNYIKKKKLKKILRKNNKFNILYVVGCLEVRNQFYFGNNQKNIFSMEWELQYQVIKLLQKYQHKYNIIVKDYPVGYPMGRSLWKSVLCDLDANNIIYISNQFTFSSLLKISDLNLFPCISTPLFESLYFNADIFFIENEDQIDLNVYKNKLKNELFYFNNVTEYINELDKYLDQGIFYKRKKENSKNYFINMKHFQKRDILLSQALAQISKV